MTTIQKSTVFVVDDDQPILDSLASLLRTMKLPAKFYGATDEFLADYDSSQPGCLLLDIRLPGNGLTLLGKLSAEGSALPVIVITGHGDRETRDKAMKLGAVVFYEKPFDAQQLCKSIRQAIEGDIATT